MSIFRKYETCRGLLLFRWKQYTAELWYCPSGYKIVEHSHPKEQIELMYLFGSTIFYRRDTSGIEESYKPKWCHVFRKFTVPAGWSHRFDVSTLPLVFINFAKWEQGSTPTSAAVDFKIKD